MNFLQIVQRLRQEAGASGTGPVTTIAQVGELLRMVNWVNSAWIDIQGMRQDWQWMRSTAAFTTVAGQPTYTATQCGVSDLGMWDRDTFRNYVNPTVTFSIASPCVMSLTAHGLSVGDTVTPYTSGALPTGLTAGLVTYVLSTPTADTVTLSLTSGGTAINTSGTQSGTHTITSNNATIFAGFKSEIYMEYDEYDNWRNAYLYGALRQVQTRPMNVTITPNKSLGLGPLPAAGYTVIGDYFKVPSEMALDADIPGLPTQHHMAIVYRALEMYGFYEQDAGVVQRAQIEFGKIMNRVMRGRLPEITANGALS